MVDAGTTVDISLKIAVSTASSITVSSVTTRATREILRQLIEVTSSLGNVIMSTRLIHGGRTSLSPAVIMFVTSPSIYVVYKI